MIYKLTILLFLISLQVPCEGKIEGFRKDLEKTFSNDFNITFSDNWIILISKKKVRIHNTINDHDGISKEEEIRDSVEKFYSFKLYFTYPKLSMENYQKLKKLQKEIVNEVRLLNENDKEAFVMVPAILMPTYYNDECSIYAFKSSKLGDTIVGDEEDKMVKSVITFLNDRFSQYEEKK